jgi:hypothetical protein
MEQDPIFTQWLEDHKEELHKYANTSSVSFGKSLCEMRRPCSYGKLYLTFYKG